MKKIILLAVAAIMTAGIASAQDVFQKGDLVFNAGVGINNALYSGSGYKSLLPPLSVSGEYGVVDNLIGGRNGSIGVGGYVGYAGSKQTFTGDYGWKYRSIVVGARGTFHYQFVKKLDTYAGAMLGYDIVSAKVFGTNTANVAASGSQFAFSLFVGARYWFVPGFGAFAEFGHGISNATLGVSFRL